MRRCAMEALGRPFYPPFRRIGEDTNMLESYPSFYWVVSRFVQPLQVIKADLPKEVRMELVGRAMVGIEMFLNSGGARDFLPRSYEKGTNFHRILNEFSNHLVASTPFAANIETVKTVLDGFSVSLQDELDRVVMFTVTPKGSLDVRSIVKSVTAGYPKATVELLDDFIKGDINHAGKCLAFEL